MAETAASSVPQWKQIKGIKLDLEGLLRQRAKYKEQIEALQEKVAGLNAAMLTALGGAGVKSVMVDATRVTVVEPGPSEKLDKKKLWTRLLELKVPEKTVKKAYADSTTVEERAAYVLVTPPKEDK